MYLAMNLRPEVDWAAGTPGKCPVGRSVLGRWGRSELKQLEQKKVIICFEGKKLLSGERMSKKKVIRCFEGKKLLSGGRMSKKKGHQVICPGPVGHCQSTPAHPITV